MKKRRMKIVFALGCMIVMALVLYPRKGLFPGLAMAQTYQLPDTGQTKCYDNGVEIPCPQPGEPFYGQDGTYRGPQPAYQDNGNGTVTDLNTGLMWQQGDSQNVGFGFTWQEAMDYCLALDLDGHTDWRLPTRHELVSLVDINSVWPNPYINTTYFPECHSIGYWTSSTYAYVDDLERAWYVYFPNGGLDVEMKIGSWYVRCVRGGP
jgi:hypothetical protein